MQIVIDIDENIYQKIKETYTVISGRKNGKRIDYILFNAVYNGTPLPKGHGRLFDERDVVNGNYEVIGNRIYGLDTLLEDDKEINADGDSN